MAADGSVDSLAWSGLGEGTGYEWYAVVSDGSNEVLSTRYSFRTNFAVSADVFIYLFREPMTEVFP